MRWREVYKDGYWQREYYGERLRAKKSEKRKNRKRKDRAGIVCSQNRKSVRKNLQAYFKYGVKKKLKGHYTAQQLRIKKIIFLLGGYKKATKILGIKSITTISKWVERGMIPLKYFPKVSQGLGGKLSAGEIAKILLS